ncbi:MAG TPA: 4-hydroxyphenylpyruvate dioxygenase, partial [Azospirillaceae bacterium]|nr:4-hydroxyphenylpyruvate dioxygenase [Azospirillaceae bacterium]
MSRAPARITDINPMGTDGFEFVEYTAPDPRQLDRLFRSMGFTALARHRSKDVTLYRQSDVNFIVNAEPDSFAQAFARVHGPSVCAIAFRVADAGHTYRRAVSLGAKGVEGRGGPMELNIPAIVGVGGSLIYLVDRYGNRSIYDVDFEPLDGSGSSDVNARPPGAGLAAIDHLTHNVHRGRMDEWAHFYEKLFNFREIRYFDIEGKLTGLKSRAMTSPCGKIRIPINESADDKSQIEEFLHAYRGEGIQHIALGSSDIFRTVEKLKAAKVRFLDTPATYYELVEKRLPGHGEDLKRLKKNRILVDGTVEGRGAARRRRLLLQIFTENLIGPIFFEIIQRKG